MPHRLDIRQLNNLFVGNALAAEIRGTTTSRRAFLAIQPYREDPDWEAGSPLLRGRKPFSKFLGANSSDVRFTLHVFEVDIDDLDAYLRESAVGYPPRPHIYTLAQQSGIGTVEDLEHDLETYLHEFEALDVHWRVIPF